MIRKLLAVGVILIPLSACAVPPPAPHDVAIQATEKGFSVKPEAGTTTIEDYTGIGVNVGPKCSGTYFASARDGVQPYLVVYKDGFTIHQGFSQPTLDVVLKTPPTDACAE